MNKWLFLVVIIFVSTFIVMIALSLKVFNFNKKPDFKTILTSDPNQTVNLPFAIDDPSVFSARIAYVIEGKVLDKIPSNNDTELKTDIKLENLPKLVLNQNTRVFYSDRTKITPAQISDLTPDQKVRIFIQYGLKSKIWTITQVNILVDKLPQTATPSANINQ